MSTCETSSTPPLSKSWMVKYMHSSPNMVSWVDRKVHFNPSTGTLTVSGLVASSESVEFLLDALSFTTSVTLLHIPNFVNSSVIKLGPLTNGKGTCEIFLGSPYGPEHLMDLSYTLQQWAQREKLRLTVVPIPSVTKDEYEVFRGVVGCTDGDRLVIEKFNAKMFVKTLSVLRPLEWLSDEVINFYLNMLMQRQGGRVRVFCWNSFFWSKLTGGGTPSGSGLDESLAAKYNYDGVKSWAKKRGVSVFSFEVILVPLHVDGAHWALGVVDFKNNRTMYLDSLGGNGQSSKVFHKIITKYLKDEDPEFNNKTETLVPFCPSSLPQQSNSSDCGVFLCIFAFAIACGMDVGKITVDDKLVNTMRMRMLTDIALGEIRY